MENLFNATGIQITVLLLLIVIVAGLVVFVLKLLFMYDRILKIREKKAAERKIRKLKKEEILELKDKQKRLDYVSPEKELSGSLPPLDEKGIVSNFNRVEELRFFPSKSRTSSFESTASVPLSKLILYFLGTASFWLIIGTTIGLYLGIKFVIPDIDHVEWLSFGRLRPAHTNIVFWGWSSLAMIGLAYYVV